MISETPLTTVGNSEPEGGVVGFTKLMEIEGQVLTQVKQPPHAYFIMHGYIESWYS